MAEGAYESLKTVPPMRGESIRSRAERGSFSVAIGLLSAVAIVLLIAPTLVVLIVSFTSGQSLRFPPPGWSLRWYEALLTDSPDLWRAATLSLQVAGQVDLQALMRLRAAISRAEAGVRHLQADLSSLQLMPTAEDIAALDADGYLGDVIAELRDAQSQGIQPDGTRPEAASVAAEALNLLATLLLEGREPAAAP